MSSLVMVYRSQAANMTERLKGSMSRRPFAKMSRLPISMKRPKVAMQSHDARRASPASELRMTSTPRLLVIRMTPAAKERSRDEKMWSAGMPYSSISSCRFSGEDTVANTSAPMFCAI